MQTFKTLNLQALAPIGSVCVRLYPKTTGNAMIILYIWLTLLNDFTLVTISEAIFSLNASLNSSLAPSWFAYSKISPLIKSLISELSLSVIVCAVIVAIILYYLVKLNNSLSRKVRASHDGRPCNSKFVSRTDSIQIRIFRIGDGERSSTSYLWPHVVPAFCQIKL